MYSNFILSTNGESQTTTYTSAAEARSCYILDSLNFTEIIFFSAIATDNVLQVAKMAKAELTKHKLQTELQKKLENKQKRRK